MKALKNLTHVLVGLSLFLDEQTLRQRGVAHISKANIEMKTRKTTEAFTIKGECDLAPPLVEVQINVLYVLLS